jgi:uncharacterized HAD superfamily protein
MYQAVPRLAFDMDGVVANFAAGFLSLVNQRFQLTLSYDQWRSYDPVMDGLMTQEQWDAGWEMLRSTPLFWAHLPCFRSTPFNSINEDMRNFVYNGYFVTRRQDTDLAESGPQDSNIQSRIWLEQNGITEASSIIAVHHSDRINLLKAIGVDAYVDDYPEQFLACRAAGIRAYLIDRPWNQGVDTPYRVFTLQQFIDRSLGRVPDEYSCLISAKDMAVPSAKVNLAKAIAI